MSAVLRVGGALLDVDRCLEWISEDKLEKVWRVGERGHLGKVKTTSGFSLLLSGAEDGQHVVREAVAAFLGVAQQVGDLVRAGATGEIDFALFVSAKRSRSIVFEPSILRVIEQYGVKIVVSAYPVAEDDSDDET
jgi:hypothetical protein